MKPAVCIAIAVTLALLASCNLDGRYRVGGVVTGLRGAGLVIEDNGSDSITIDANGHFTFSTKVKKKLNYAVTVTTQPSNPAQTCTVHNGSGTIAALDVVNVIVSCVQPGRFVYVANQAANTISGYVIDQTSGALVALAGSPFPSTGTSPIDLKVDPNGDYLYIVNNLSSNVTVYGIDYASGTLTIAAEAIGTGHAPTSAVVDPSNSYMYVANSTDNTVSAFSLSNGLATPIAGSPYAVGRFPFSLRTDPNGNFLYVANFDDGTVSAFAIGLGTGELSAVAGSPFAAGAGSISVAIDPSGTFAYVANETAATISSYVLDPVTGVLSAVSGPVIATGSSPESIAVDLGGSFVFTANAPSNDSVADYRITASTGVLVAGSTASTGLSPLAVAIDPSGAWVYTANSKSATVSGFTLDPGTGALTGIAGSPYSAASGARAIAID